MNPRARTTLRALLVVASVAVAYNVSARLLIALSAPPHGAIATVWLPSGLTVAALLLFGPFAALGAFLGSASFEFSAGTPLLGAIIVGAANAGGEFLCYHLIRGRAKRPFSVDAVGDVGRLLMASGVGAVASATVGISAYVVFGVLPVASFGTSWLVWFGSVVVGVVLVTPLLVYSIRKRHGLGRPVRYVEFVSALCALTISSFLLQEPTFSTITQDLMVAVTIMVFIWIAFRFSPREMTLAVVLFTVSAISGVVLRAGTATPSDGYLTTFSLQALLGGTGMIAYLLASVTARQARTNEELRLAARIYETTSEGIMVTTPAGEIASVNDSFGRITGYTRSEALGQNPRFMKSDRHSEEFFKGMWEALAASGVWQGEVWNRRADGSLLPTWLSISSVKDAGGATTDYVGLFSDITAIKRGEEDLQWLATHDPLTSLPNRTLLDDRLTNLLARSRRREVAAAVFYFDLDHFKDVNDALGHPAGDRLLVEVARRCVSVLREGDTVGRSGGDEFTVIVSDYSSVEDLSLLAQRLLSLIQEPVELDGREAYVTASIGIAMYPEDGTDAAELTKHADVAMYRAKSLGKNRFQFFSAGLQDELQNRLETEAGLRNALKDGQLFLVYQPQVDLGTGRIVGVEALVRWRETDGSVIMPEQFIPIAEASGLILEVGATVLRQACADMRTLLDEGHRLTVAINVSARELMEQDVATIVVAAINAAGLNPSAFEVEITESSIVTRTEIVAAKVRGLQDHDVAVSIDDFGTGYASMAYVMDFHPSKLKIDRSFVSAVPVDPSACAIVSATIALAKGIGAKVLAEGPETEAHVRYLRESGCDYAQGYYFSEPIPLEELRELLDRGPFPLPD